MAEPGSRGGNTRWRSCCRTATRSFVYVDCVIVGSPETLRTPETRGAEVSFFYIGGGEGYSNSDVTVTNVFLYDRPPSVGEIKTVKKGGDGSMREGVSRVLLLLLLGLWGFVALY